MARHTHSAPASSGALDPTPETGLTREEVRRRTELGLTNAAAEDAGKSVWEIIGGNLFTLFNLLNFGLALCLVLVGSYRNMLFLGVVISNTLIGTIQELRARKTVRSLTLMTREPVRVIREGSQEEVLPDALVQGDLVVLSRGAQIPADGPVRSGICRVNESLLTGESNEIPKKAGDRLLSGSFLTAGSVVMCLENVGADSYIARLTREAKQIRSPRSQLMQDLKKLVRVLTMILIPLGLLLFVKQYFMRHAPLDSAVPQTVAAMVGMIPEGLMLLTSVALTVGVVRLGRRGALVQELFGIETLSRADVLCLDKTGTLTTGHMHLFGLIPVGTDMPGLENGISRFLGAFPEDESQTTHALREALPTGNVPADDVLPFSSQRKLSAVTFGNTTYVLGAAGFVPVTVPEDIQAQIREHASSGRRVLVFCEAAGRIDRENLPDALRLLGLVLIEDQLRPHVQETLGYFREQGVSLRVISGDDPLTVSAVAQRCGLEHAAEAVDVSKLTPEQFPDAVQRCTVFGRVTPENKKLLVEEFKRQGHHVAMTGDGVNDIPALKAADCSIAMASGSEAARHCAQLTLVESDFSVLPQVVNEGRRVVNNIARSASLFLIKTLYSMMLAFLLLFLPAAYPFQPIQLTLTSSLTIGAPSFFLALESNHDRITGHFLRKVLGKAIPGALCVTLASVFAMLMEHTGWTPEACSTFAALSAGGIGLINLLFTCLPLNLYRGMVMLAMSVGLFLSERFLGHLFFLVHLDTRQYLMLFAAYAIAALLMLLARFLSARQESGHHSKNP